MESPFANSNKTFVVYVEPFRNNYYKTYQNILTVSVRPPGPLEAMIKEISFEKLSPFERSGSLNGGIMCSHVILRYPRNSVNSSAKNPDMYMTSDDIPSLLSYLHENNYEVDTSMTKMLQQSRIPTTENRRMVCMVKQL
tara:strand:- start:1317 stop:1733 length:417 start_codon:yes stop_codon:yes gene_type:complete